MTSLAENREQHIQRFHEQMESWEQEMNRVRSMAFSANSYIQGEMNRLIAQLDKGLEQLTHKMVQLAETGDQRVYTVLETMESAWGSVKSTIGDISHRLREKGEQAQDKLERGASEARDAIREKVDEGMSQAKQALNQGKQAVRETVEQGGDAARDLIGQGKSTLRETAEQVGNAAQSAGKRGQQPSSSQAPGGKMQTEEPVVVSRTRTPPH